MPLLRRLWRMSARIPLDVDLEDKLLYGLTPTRLAYFVIALLAAFAVWSGGWAVAPIRATCALAIVAIGAAAAWGRWRGRHTDSWMVDIAAFCCATYRIRCMRPGFMRRRFLRRR